MKIEYFEDEDCLNCPLILIYGNEPAEAATLRHTVEGLALGRIDRVTIHELPGFTSVENCRLVAGISQTDMGIRPTKDKLSFECFLQSKTWLHVSDLLEPFTARDETGQICFQYLDETNKISLLISTARAW